MSQAHRIAAVLLAALAVAAGAAAAPSPALLKQLQGGGYVLVLRHAIELEEGEVIVFRPLGNSRFRVAGRIPADAWNSLRKPASATELRVNEYDVPAGSGPHDVAPADDGTVWYTAQHAGNLGRLDPATGKTTSVPLGDGSAPHGVIVGPDGAAW